MASAKRPRKSSPDPGPTVFVLFGATGDLAKRMVLPAFYLRTGKRLAATKQRVSLILREANVLSFSLAGDGEINLSLVQHAVSPLPVLGWRDVHCW